MGQLKPESVYLEDELSTLAYGESLAQRLPAEDYARPRSPH